MRYIGLIMLVLVLAACGGTTNSASSANTSTFSVRAATIKACKDILAFQDGNATDTFANDPASVKALNDAEDTPLEADLQAWVNDLQDAAPYQQIETDADKVGADCGEVGIKLFPVPSS